jgi:HNH endonuclease
MPAHIGEPTEILVKRRHGRGARQRLGRKVGVAEIHIRRLYPRERRKHQCFVLYWATPRAHHLGQYLLGGAVDTKLLEVRVFDKKIARTAYAKQTEAVEAKGKSNCPLCAVGHGANKARIYKFEEMEADHVAAWSKGGDSSTKNCQMLCITHNRAKGNR